MIEFILSVTKHSLWDSTFPTDHKESRGPNLVSIQK